MSKNTKDFPNTTSPKQKPKDKAGNHPKETSARCFPIGLSVETASATEKKSFLMVENTMKQTLTTAVEEEMQNE